MAFRTNKTPVLQEKSASGSVASFNTALAMPLVECKTEFMCTEIGTGEKSPSNPYTLVGVDDIKLTYGGKNLVNINTIVDSLVANGATLDSENHTVTYDGRIANLTGIFYSDFIPNTQYSLYFKLSVDSGAAANPNIQWVYTDGTAESIYGVRGDFVIRRSNANKTLAYITFKWVSGTTVLDYEKFGLMQGATFLVDYEPYISNTVTLIDLDGTRYGGYVDVVGKKLVLTDNLYTPAKADWRIKDGNNYYTKTYSELVGTGYLTGLCNKFNKREGTVSNREWWVSNQGIICICITDTTYNTVGDMYDDVGEISFVVPLRTPIEISLSDIPELSTIIGNNSFASDSGDIDLTYKDLDIAKRGNFREVFKLPS